jgi:hypothetical protein
VYLSLFIASIGGIGIAFAIRSSYVATLEKMRGPITATDAGVEADGQLRCEWSKHLSVAIAPDRVYCVGRPSRSVLATRSSFESDDEWSRFVATVEAHVPNATRLDALPAPEEVAPLAVAPVPPRETSVPDGAISVEFVLEARDVLQQAPLGLGRQPGRAFATVMYMTVGFVVIGVFMSWTIAVASLPLTFAVGWWILPAVRATGLNQRLLAKSQRGGEQILRRRQARAGRPELPYAARATIDPERFMWETDRGTRIVPWSSIFGVGVKHDALVVRLEPRLVAIVPKRAFATDAAWDEFTELAISYRRSAGSRVRPS